MILRLRRKRPITAPNPTAATTTNLARRRRVAGPPARAVLRLALPLTCLVLARPLPVLGEQPRVLPPPASAKPLSVAAARAMRSTRPSTRLRLTSSSESREFVEQTGAAGSVKQVQYRTSDESPVIRSGGGLDPRAAGGSNWRTRGGASRGEARIASAPGLSLNAPTGERRGWSQRSAAPSRSGDGITLRDEARIATRPEPLNPAQGAPRRSVDPFDDPFGDTRPPAIIERPGSADVEGGETAMPLEGQDATADRRRLDPPATPSAEFGAGGEAAEPLEPALEPSSVEPSLDPFGDGGSQQRYYPRASAEHRVFGRRLQDAADDRKKCEHVYNGVDCCSQGEACQVIEKYLKDRPLAAISLDITPSFNPGFGEQDQSEELRDRRLADLDTRSWKNLAGETIAEGRFVDFLEGRVIIVDEQGERKQLAYYELSNDDRCYVTAWWSLPPECLLTSDDYQGRHFMPITMTWKASALCHKPLYFEQVQLERYGHTAGPIKQPVLSTAHFFVSLATLPYHIGVHPMNECQYPLGHYRPGNCAPWLLPAVPISLRGGLMQAGAVLGGIYVLP